MRFHQRVVLSAGLRVAVTALVAVTAVFAATAVTSATAAAATVTPPTAAATATKPVKLLPVPKERTVVTHHHVVIDGRSIAYTATAGTLLLYNAKHQPTASVFYIAYTRDGAHGAANRPVTFAYNGGPGFASALVDIGGFGPRRIVWPAPGDLQAQQPPYRLVANDDSILASSDLVFIDAIGTGYSRLAGAGTPKMFYGIKGDASAFAQFIQRYITRFDRWNSPKFLLGESYGTTRSAVLAQDLVAKGVYVNGVILCSTVLDLPTINFSAGNDLPYALYLPSYAAVAWYHHRLQPQPASLQAAVSAAEQFAATDYQQALFAGSALAPAARARVAARLAQLTGIPAALWLRADLRMTLPVFMRRLLGDAGAMTGRYDARYTAPELQPLLPVPGHSDAGATTTAIWGALAASFDRYLRDDLHYTSTHLYKQDSGKVFKAWSWSYRSPLNSVGSGVGNLQARDVAPALARAMNNDPGMQLMLNNGYFDMATPFFATDYTIRHMGLPAAALAGRVHEFDYPVGHMLYLNPQVLPVLSRHIDAFIAGAAPAGHG